MKQVKTLLVIGLGLAFLAGIGACTSSGTIPTLTDANTLLTAQAANPLPTEMAGQGLRVVPADVCQVLSPPVSWFVIAGEAMLTIKELVAVKAE